jgi:3'-phosphoadenosine 5'-phosphosulfate sulfotransferase (PAPS reductase)/FAD synthetase
MDIKQLREMQSWSLDQKMYHSLEVIDTFYQRLNGKCYVSFSGGKDSTIVLWLARKIYPNIKGCFCNTGNEYPDIVKFVRTFDNIDWIRPKLKPKEVLAKYGFPLVSKQISGLANIGKNHKNTKRGGQVLGLTNDSKFRHKISEKYRYLCFEPYDVDNICCTKLKKEPFHKYEKENNISPILGTMAEESMQRTTDYLKGGGCNIFSDGGKTKSMPLSIWLEKDVWECIEKYHIPISEIYHKGAKRTGCMFCGYGCQFKNDNRLQLVHDLYPKWYDTFMNYTNNGVTYREAMRKVLAVNGLSLPDENIELELDFKQ